jgi:hypothetical protein
MRSSRAGGVGLQPAIDSRQPAAQGLVVSYSPSDKFNPRSHECVTRMQIAQKLALLMGYEFAGDYDDTCAYREALYFVPSCTLVGCDAAARLGIRDEGDLFGGVVPHPYVATKTITHPLIDDDAVKPIGWCPKFTDAVADTVLHGFAAFTCDEALRAGTRLLEHGTVRVKPALALGGRGQSVVNAADELEAVLDAIDREELESCGVVLEENLSDVTTFSVGQVSVAGLVASYFGTQEVTFDNGGAEVYGGSDLVVARGDFDALLGLEWDAAARCAVVKAQAYDRAACMHFAGFFASRRNYDVVLGTSSDGQSRCGVLEQSWRIGGASGAELAALEALRADPGVRAVHARCIERYGETIAAPTDSLVSFRGVDEKVGFITKATLQTRVHA